MTSKFAGQDVASWVGIGGGVTGKAHVSQPGGAAPSGGVKSTNKDVDAVVATMQNLMADLGTKLSTPDAAQAVVGRLQQENPNTKVTAKMITDQAVHFARTGSSTSSRATAADGVWGKNTHDALVAIQNLVAQLNIKDVIISEGTGPAPYKSMKDEELIERARDNISNISRIFGALGIQTSIESVGESSGMVVVDMVDPYLLESGLTDPFGAGWGTRAVTMGNLADLLSFFDFMSGLRPSFPCNSLGGDKEVPKAETVPARPVTAALDDYFERLAKEVLDRSIIRFGQAVEAAPPSAAPTVSDPHCVSVIDEVIKWFSERSRIIFNEFFPERLRNRLPNPRPDQKGKIVTMHDAQLGAFYVQQMDAISNTWNDIKDSIIKAFKAQGKTNPPIVTRKMIRDALSGVGTSGTTTGKAHKRRDDGGNGGEDVEGMTIHRRQQKPPLDRFMALSNFSGDAVDRVAKLSAGGVLPEINLREWSSGAWTSLAQSDVAGQDDAQKYANFGPWAAAIRDALRDAYNEWKSYGPNDQLLEQQRDWLNRWVGRINATIGTWQGEFKERMERARRGL